MSFQMVCDICGKDSGRGKAIFNTGAMEIEIKNYEDKDFKVLVQVTVQDTSDTEFLEGLKNKTQEELAELANRDDLSIKTPDPHICVACQRCLANKILKDGFLDPNKTCKKEIPVLLQELILSEDEFYDDEEFTDEELRDDDDEEN